MFHVINTQSSAVMNPFASGYQSAPKDKQEYNGFLEEENARKFAEYCASKWRGSEFGLTKLIAKVKTAEPPVSWTEVK